MGVRVGALAPPTEVLVLEPQGTGPVARERGSRSLPGRFAFTWPGRDEALAVARAPVFSRLVPQPEASSGTPPPHHLFIEGENLEALKLLLPTHAGRVRMIYIDPPYNTGGRFVFRDRFDSWLSLIYPRLVVARELLREDGAIFVSIDDHEVHHLRLAMDEIFGAACFKNCIVVRRGVKSVQAQFCAVDSLGVGHEYVLLYARSAQTRFPPLRLPREEPKPGTWNSHWRGTERPTMRYELFGITPARGQWRWQKERSERAAANYQRMLVELGREEAEVTQEEIDAWYAREVERANRRVDLLRLSPTGRPEHYVPPARTKLGSDLWTDINPSGSAELAALLGARVLDHPKPVALIRRMLEFATEPAAGDIVLDFFAGSCTTAHAVLEANHDDGGNRSFIMVQSPEPLPRPVTLADGALLYTLADVGRERIRRVLACGRHGRKGRIAISGESRREDERFRLSRVVETAKPQF